MPTIENLLEDCQKRPEVHRIVFTLDDDDGNATLRFILDNEIREIELLMLDNFRQLDDERINM